MVCHIDALRSCRTEEWDIILLPDPQGTLGEVGIRAMGRFHGYYDQELHRVYGFVQPGIRLRRRGRIRLEMVAGQVIYRLGPERSGVCVLWLPTPDIARINKEMTSLEFRWKAYWHNDRCNDYIAAGARTCVNQGAWTLGEYGFRSGLRTGAAEHAVRQGHGDGGLAGRGDGQAAPGAEGPGRHSLQELKERTRRMGHGREDGDHPHRDRGDAQRVPGDRGRGAVGAGPGPPAVNKEKRDVIPMDFLGGFDQQPPTT